MDDNECMETCRVGVLCPHGASCDHIGAGRITHEELEVLFMYMLRKEKELREGIAALVDKMTTTVHFYKIADETAQRYASDLKELIE